MSQLDLLRFVPFRLDRLAAEIGRGLTGVHGGPFGLDATEWRVLATLGRREPRSARFIGRCTRTHKSKVSRAVTRLALAGLVEGAPSSHDRRETPLRLTAKGRALHAELTPLVLGYEQRLLDGLAPEERRGLVRGLDALERALGLLQEPDRRP